MMDPLETLAPKVLFGAVMILAGAALVMLFRTLIGPRMSDRIVGVNMIGTQSICIIACLVLWLREDWIVDIGIIYAMFSFLAVTVLTKMDIGVYRQWREDQRRSQEHSRQNGETLASARRSRQTGGRRGRKENP